MLCVQGRRGASPAPQPAGPGRTRQDAPALPRHPPCVGSEGAAPITAHARSGSEQGAQVQLVLTEQSKGSRAPRGQQGRDWNPGEGGSPAWLPRNSHPKGLPAWVPPPLAGERDFVE